MKENILVVIIAITGHVISTSANFNVQSNNQAMIWTPETKISPTKIEKLETLPECPESSIEKNIVIPNPQDCQSYYKCKNGTPFYKKCPEGLRFDVVKMACTFPNKAHCADETTTAPIITSKKPTTVTSSSTKTVTNDVTSTVTSSPTIAVTNDPTSSVTNSSTTTITSGPITTMTSSQTTTMTSSTTTSVTSDPTTIITKETTIITTNPTTTDRPGYVPECPKGSNGKNIVIPNPEDCESFYRCDNGNPIKKSCPKGLLFDVVKMTCTRLHEAQCANETATITSIKPTSTVTSGPTTVTNRPTTTVTNNPTSTITSNPTTTETSGPTTTVTSGSTTAVTNEPPTSMTTKPTTTVTGSTTTTVTSSPTTTVTSDPTTMVTEETTVITTNPTTTDRPSYVPKCPKGSNGKNIVIPNPEDCESFYRCDNGIPIKKNCPKGLLFDVVKMTCTRPHEAQCANKTTTITSIKPTSTVTSGPTTVTNRPTTTVTNNSTSTITNSPTTTETSSPTTTATSEPTTTVTSGPTTTVTNEPPTSMTTKPTTTVTGSPTTTVTSDPTTIITEETTVITTNPTTTDRPGYVPECPKGSNGKNIVIPNPEDCESFYRCDNGNPIKKSCPKGLLFDVVKMTCTRLHEAQCANETATITSIKPTSTVTSGPTTVTNRPTTTVTNNPTSTITNSPTTTETSSPATTATSGPTTTVTSGPTTSVTSELPTSMTTKPTTTVTSSTTTTVTSSPTTTVTSDPTTIVTEESTIITTNPTTTDRPGYVPECPKGSNGKNIVIPNPEDCESFYRCDNGNPIKKSCPKGLLFDVVKMTCTRPHEAQCAYQTTTITSIKPTSTVTSGPTTVTNRPTTTVTNNPTSTITNSPTTTETSSPATTATSGPTTTVTSGPTTSVTSELPTSMTTKPTTTVASSTTTTVTSSPTTTVTSDITTVVTGETTITTIRPTTTEGPQYLPECPKETSENNIVIPNPEDCESYYRCKDGNHIKLWCPKGLRFDVVKMSCTLPNEAHCAVQTSTVSTTIPTQQTTISTSSATTTDNPQQLPQCPKTTSEENIVMPNFEDCKSYFRCKNGIREKTLCPSGLQFDSVKMICTYPHEAHCEGQTSTISTTISTEETTLPTIGTTTTEYPQKLPQCPESTSENNIVIPNPEDCESYYRCKDGNHIKLWCPKGLRFDVVKMSCTLPNEAHCAVQTSTVSTTIPTQQTTISTSSATTTDNPQQLPQCPKTTSEENIVMPNFEDCKSYFRCKNGIREKTLCPSGLQFDSVKMICTYPHEAHCEGQTSTISTTISTEETTLPTIGTTTTEYPQKLPQCPESTSENNIVIPNPEDCESYYRCKDGNHIKLWCPKGLRFDVVKMSCTLPNEAHCAVQTSTVSTTISTQQTTISTSSTTTTDNPQQLPQCPKTTAEKNVVMPNSQDCKSYYRCKNGIAIHKWCPKGLYFNAVKMICTYPHESHCET